VNCLKAYCNKDGEGVYYKCKEHVNNFTNKTAILLKTIKNFDQLFFLITLVKYFTIYIQKEMIHHEMVGKSKGEHGLGSD
jgi:hypothetical protein